MCTGIRQGGLRGVAVAAAALLVALACGTSQGSQAASSPGVTADSILIGTTQPLSGAGSLYASVSRGSNAYFAYLNDRGGVGGRKISYKVYDDANDPSRAVALARQLVTQDGVFAVANELGTPINLATRPYVNQEPVRGLFVGTGSSPCGLAHMQ